MWFFPWCALGDACQRVPCATALLTRSIIVPMGLLLRAADSGGLGSALAAKGITASGQNMSVAAEAIEQRVAPLYGGASSPADTADPLTEVHGVLDYLTVGSRPRYQVPDGRKRHRGGDRRRRLSLPMAVLSSVQRSILVPVRPRTSASRRTRTLVVSVRPGSPTAQSAPVVRVFQRGA